MNDVPLRAALRERFSRVALAHEWLTIPGGSEKVVMALLDLFPHAELFTTVYDPAPWPAQITARKVTASALNRIPAATRLYPRLLPLMDGAFRSFDLSGFDLVLSSNHACAKNVRKPAGVPHVCYCHTPMRYAWEPSYLVGEQVGWASRLAFRALAPRLRRRDREAAALPGGPDVCVANSSFVAQRIARWWGREAQVIHPPVDVDRFLGQPRQPRDYFLVLGRVVPYKRVDVAVAACRRLGRPLKVAGSGRALDAARALAGPETEFLGYVPDAELGPLLSGARALLFCGEEDFGIVPVEAQAAGVPVIAYGAGGVLDSVRDGETGVLYPEPGVDSLAAAIERFDSLTLDEATLRDQARRFSPERFAERFGALMQAVGSRWSG